MLTPCRAFSGCCFDAVERTNNVPSGIITGRLGYLPILPRNGNMQFSPDSMKEQRHLRPEFGIADTVDRSSASVRPFCQPQSTFKEGKGA